MAPRQAPPAQAGAGEVSEREYQATLNRAVEDTEQEIFTDALGADELDNDGDTSLEEMGEGLEGEVEDDPEEEAEGEGEEAEAEGEEGEEPETAEADEPDGGDAEFERENRDQRQDDRRIPPGRLREEAERRRSVEERNAALERQVAEMNGRLAELSARQNAPQPRQAEPPQPKPEPDVFGDPEAWKQWNREDAVRVAREEAQALFTQFRQQQHEEFLQRENIRVDSSLNDAANSDRGVEFAPAFLALTTLDRNSPQNRAIVSAIYNSPNPGKALFDWWDRNGGPEFRERYGYEEPSRQQRSAPRGRSPDDRFGDRRGEQQPRHVIRPGQRLPSLNSATGSNSQRISDPEMLDGSDGAIFRYGTRR